MPDTYTPQLRSAALVMVSIIKEVDGSASVIPAKFGRSFNYSRMLDWDYVGAISQIMDIEPVLNRVSASFSFGRAAVFSQTLVSLGMIPRMNQIALYKPFHLQMNDLVDGKTLCLFVGAVTSAARTNVNRATTIGTDINGMGKWAYCRSELPE